jgi:6-phosphogluconolactonase
MNTGFYIGTYTGHGSDGIYFSSLDPATGVIEKPILAAKTDNPSFLALHPAGKYLYAVNENGPDAAAISAFSIDPKTAELTLINRQPSHGSYPCHVSIHPSGSCALVANYGTGTFASFAIHPDGSVAPAGSVHQDKGHGPIADRQEGPHAHGIWPMPAKSTPAHTPAERGANGQVIACDLGIDQLPLFRLDPAAATLVPADPASLALPPGTGPRHLVFSRDRRFLYVIGELANTISVLDVSKFPQFQLIQTPSTLAPNFAGKNKAAELALHPTADILYASNRGADDLVTFAVDPATGHLREQARTPIGGRGPRHFAIDPTGAWLLAANEDSHSITTFKLDPLPRPAGTPLFLTSPVCILFSA